VAIKLLISLPFSVIKYQHALQGNGYNVVVCDGTANENGALRFFLIEFHRKLIDYSFRYLKYPTTMMMDRIA
jgi:hypothetical protein